VGQLESIRTSVVIMEPCERRRLFAVSMHGAIVEDVNANGVQESGETLPIWTPTIYADLNYNGTLDAGEPSTTQPFAQTGYTLSLPGSGTYRLRAILPDTYVATIPASGSIDVVVQDRFAYFGANFGGWRTGRYAARPFIDADGDGARGANEFSAFSRTLWADLDRDGVMDPNEPASAPDSNASALDLRPGTYLMRLHERPAWTNTTAPAGLDRNIDAGTANFTEALGQIGTPNVVGTLAQDANGSEALDPSDPRLAGWVIFADLDKDGVRDAGEPFDQTKADGTFALIDPALAAPFWLRLVEPNGRLNVFLRSYMSAATENNFANDDVLLRVTNIAAGSLFADTNGNGIYDPATGVDDHFIAGQLVYADVNGNGQRDPNEPEASTNTVGQFLLPVPNGTFPIRPEAGNDYAVNPASPAFPAYAFGFNGRNSIGSLAMLDNRPGRTHAHVQGMVFDDRNRNGRWDPSEIPQAPQVVYIDLNADGRRNADEPFTTTGPDGRFTLLDQQETTGVGPIIRVETRNGWRNTQIGRVEGRNLQLHKLQTAVETLGIYQAPEVGLASAAFDVDDRQAVRLDFTHDLGSSLQGGDFVLYTLHNGNWVATAAQWAVQSTLQDGRSSAALRLPNLLGDGQYRLEIPAQSIADTTGHKNPAPLRFDFFVLAGDLNRDRSVDFLDLAVMAQNYNITAGKTFADGDFNYDGGVDFLDLAVLAQRYNTSLAAPGVPAPLPAGTGVSFSVDWAAALAAQATYAPTAKPSKVKPAPKPVFHPGPPIRVKALPPRRRG
jgi:hypothetical protein